MRIKTKISTKPIAFSEAAERFLRVKKAAKVRPRTLKDYEIVFNSFLKVSHNTLEFSVLCDDLLDFFSTIPDTSPAVYNRPYSCLHALFNWCVLDDIIPSNPLTKLGLKKRKDEGTIHAATIDDVKSLLKVCDRTTFTGLRDYTIILVLLDCGIRTCELVRLRNGDYDVKNHSLTVWRENAKTRRERICYLSDATAAALNKYLQQKPYDIEWIFPSRDCNQLDTNELARQFRKLCDIAKVKITPYQLRHSFATYFLENGGNVLVLQKLMGHSDLRMTQRYTDISESTKKSAQCDFTPTNLLLPSTRLL